MPNTLASNIPAMGMNQDAHPKFQPQGTYRSALNAVLESVSGDVPSMSNEIGNIEVAEGYPASKKIIGHRLLDDGTTVVFLFDPSTSRPSHEIGFFDPQKKTYTTYKAAECLNFSADHYINPIYRLKNGCERVVYFTDNYNTYRVINLDRPEYYGPGTSLTSCDKLKYSRDIYQPTFQLEVLPSGGEILPGTLFFGIRFLDESFNPSDWTLLSHSVPIIADTESATQPMFYNGATANSSEVGYSTTSKAVQVTVTDVDTRYIYAQLAVVKYQASSGALSGIDVLAPVPIEQTGGPLTTISYLYTGSVSQVTEQTSLDEILSSRLRIDRVGTHEQKDGRLFPANITQTVKDYSSFQRHASSIEVQWEESSTVVFDKEGTSDSYGFSKTVDFYNGAGHFMADEVYALGIVYVWNDGEVSPAFPIPGRPMFDNSDDSFGLNPYISTNKDEWDSYDVTGDPNIYNDGKTLRWQVYNTCTEANPTNRYMGYYETSTTYPDIEICDDHPDGYWGRDWTGALIVPGVTKIRHHKMPMRPAVDAADPDFPMIRNTNFGIKFIMTDEYPHEDIIGHYYVYGDRTNDKTILDKGTFGGLDYA